MNDDRTENSGRAITPSEHQRVSKNFIGRLWAVFGEPKTNDLESFVDEYIRALCRYDNTQLTEGADHLFRTMKKEFRISHWPTIRECLDSCSAASKDIYSRQHKPSSDARHDWDASTRTEHEERRAKEMIRGPFAERAVAGGWIVGLFDFVRDHGKLPTGDEEQKLIEASAFVRDCAAGRVDMGALRGPLHKLATSMLERRAKLENEFREATQ